MYYQLNNTISKWYGLVWIMEGVWNWDICAIYLRNLK